MCVPIALVASGEGGMGRGEEELGRTAAGLAWQTQSPLSSVGAMRFPKWFWAA